MGEATSIWTSLAPFWRRSLIIFLLVVPLTMESSMRMRRLPFMLERKTLSFILTLLSRISWLGWIKERPTYLFLERAST